MLVIMKTPIDSNVDTLSARVIKKHDVTEMRLGSLDEPPSSRDSSDARSNEPDRSRCTSCLPDIGLPEIPEQSDCAEDPNMPLWRGKPNGRPGRKYRVADMNGQTNEHGRIKQYEVGSVEGSLFNKSQEKMDFNSEGQHPEQQDQLQRSSSNSSSSSLPLSRNNIRVPTSSMVQSSPRLPRRLPSLSRSGSHESPDVSPRDVTDVKGNNGRDQSGIRSDFTADVSWSPHSSLPTSSSVFQKVLTDLNDRPDSSMSIISSGKSSPGDLIVRRSSLRTSTGITLPPALQEVDESQEIGEALSYLGLDLVLSKPDDDNQDGGNAEVVEKDESSKCSPSKRHSKHTRDQTVVKTHSPPRRKVSKNKAPPLTNDGTDVKVVEHQGTSPRRSIKYPAAAAAAAAADAAGHDRRQSCPAEDVSCQDGPNIVVSSPREDMLHEAASRVHKAQTSLKKWRSINAPGSAVSTNSSEASISPERSRKKTRSISLTSPRYRAVSPARSHHEYPPSIDMKTAGQIARFITMAAASSKAPGLNDRSQQLLPSDVVHLPNLDPTGRLLHRRRDRDEPMRVIKQAVNHNAEDDTENEQSDVYSIDELRDCRYLRTRKDGKDSRRNSLLGFNEI